MKISQKFHKQLNDFSVLSKNSIKTLMLAIALALCTPVFANNDPTPSIAEATNAISIEIGKLLKNPKFLVDDEMTAEVKIVINEDNELVVLSVSSNNEELENFIKGRLNYKELSTKLRTGQKSFLVPVRLIQDK